MEVRRIVTGHATNGSSVDDDASVVVPLDGATQLVELWRVVGPLTEPGAGFAPAESQGIVAEPGGLAWRLFVLGPGERPVHRTSTLDLLEVLHGEIVVVLEDGDVPLREGECLVLRGDQHGWRNDRDSPAVLAATMVAAEDVVAERSPVSTGRERGPRRVVTGLDGQHRSTAAADGSPPSVWALAPGVAVAELWQTAAPLTHPAQGTDLTGGPFSWPPAGGGIAWRHVTLDAGAPLLLDGDRLDLLLVRGDAVVIEAAPRGEREVGDGRELGGVAAVVRRGDPLALRNVSGTPCQLSVVSVAPATGAASAGR